MALESFWNFCRVPSLVSNLSGTPAVLHMETDSSVADVMPGWEMNRSMMPLVEPHIAKNLPFWACSPRMSWRRVPVILFPNCSQFCQQTRASCRLHSRTEFMAILELLRRSVTPRRFSAQFCDWAQRRAAPARVFCAQMTLSSLSSDRSHASKARTRSFKAQSGVGAPAFR